MRLILNRGYVVTAAAVLTLLTGCLQSFAQETLSQPLQNSVARPGIGSQGPIAVRPFLDSEAIQKSQLEIFVSDAANNVVDIYNRSGKLLGQLTGLSEPQGITSDGKGNLYVADTSNSRIQIYAAGYKKPPTTMNDPGQYPVDVSVLDNGEFVAVTNIISTSGGAGSVTLYQKGKAGPTISNSSFTQLYFCAFDANGDLFVDGLDTSGNVLIGEIANLTRGGKKLKTLRLNGATILFPGGVQVTAHDKIAILDQEAATIYTFNLPKNGSLGPPIATTPLVGLSDAVTFAFTKSNRDLWTPNAAAVDEFAYPAGGSPVITIPVKGGELIGVAIVPAAMP